MPKPNYKFEKRQKDIAKKKKQEEKLKRKQEKSGSHSQDNPDSSAGTGDTN
jgi:hypothetical protein